MAYPKLTNQKIEEIKERYRILGSMPAVSRELDYNYRTVSKYVGPIDKDIIEDARVIEVYALTGSLQSVANIVGLSKTSVWRRLKKNNVVVGRGVKHWKRLYSTLRARVSRSAWRQAVLEEYSSKCAVCREYSVTVHHLSMKLSEIRDAVLKQYPEINPFRSFEELRRFTDIVMLMHEQCDGIVLCKQHHEEEHGK